MDVEGTHPEAFPASVNTKRQAKANGKQRNPWNLMIPRVLLCPLRDSNPGHAD